MKFKSVFSNKFLKKMFTAYLEYHQSQFTDEKIRSLEYSKDLCLSYDWLEIFLKEEYSNLTQDQADALRINIITYCQSAGLLEAGSPKIRERAITLINETWFDRHQTIFGIFLSGVMALLVAAAQHFLFGTTSAE